MIALLKKVVSLDRTVGKWGIGSKAKRSSNSEKSSKNIKRWLPPPKLPSGYVTIRHQIIDWTDFLRNLSLDDFI